MSKHMSELMTYNGKYIKFYIDPLDRSRIYFSTGANISKIVKNPISQNRRKQVFYRLNDRIKRGDIIDINSLAGALRSDLMWEYCGMTEAETIKALLRA